MRRFQLQWIVAATLALAACGQGYDEEFEAEREPEQNNPTTGLEAATSGTSIDTFGTIQTDTLGAGQAGQAQ